MRSLIVLLGILVTATLADAAEISLAEAAKSVVLLHAPAAGGATKVGTGFLVQLPGVLYLVTAEHVVRDLGPDPQLTFGDESDTPVTMSLASAAGRSPLAWVFHGTADVAVLEVAGGTDSVRLLATRALPPPLLVSKLMAPGRERTVTVIGFPLGLGAISLGPDRHISAISRDSRPVSGLITIARFDTRRPATFFFLDSPAIGGFSGAPVFMFPGVVAMQQGIAFGPPEAFCMGLMHGTVTDNTGGKLAAVVPVAYIVETIEKAFRARPQPPN